MKKRLFLSIFSLIFVAMTLSGCSFSFKNLFWGSGSGTPPDTTKKGLPNAATFNVVSEKLLSDIEAAKEASELDGYVNTKEIVKHIKNTVVQVKVTTNDKEQSVSGVVISQGELRADEKDANPKITKKSYIAINHHVYDAAVKLSVFDASGNEYPATLIGGDPDSDICVLSVYAELEAVEFHTNTDMLEVGEDTLAVGYPFGNLGGTVTKGILSGVAEEFDFGDEKAVLMQTDTAISRGFSGGGLFSGRIFIGLIDKKYNDYYGGVNDVSFVIPANKVLEISKELIKTSSSTSFGYISGKYLLGCTLADDYANRWGTQLQVVVKAIDPNGSFYRSDLEVGDFIKNVRYNDGEQYTVTTTSELIEHLGSIDFKIGDTLTLGITRGGTNRNVTVTIEQYIYGK